MNPDSSSGAVRAAAVPVWPLLARLTHVALAAGVLGSLVLYQGGPWHQRLGWLALLAAALRLVWGAFSRRQAVQLRAFVRGPGVTLAYALSLWRGREARHIGHNPLGGWMILLLLGLALLAGASGVLYSTDRYWGDERVYVMHSSCSWLLAGLVPLHLLGVLVASLRHRENLVLAMLNGAKRAPGPGDVGLGGDPVVEP